MDTIVADELGPIAIEYDEGNIKTYILVTVEFVTQQVHLIPMAKQDTPNLIIASELLVACQGKFCTLVLDKHSTRRTLGNQPKLHEVDSSIRVKNRNPTLYNLYTKNRTNSLEEYGIRVVVASGDYHRLLGRTEHVVYQVKQMLISAFKGAPCKTLFSLYHRLAIVESWIRRKNGW